MQRKQQDDTYFRLNNELNIPKDGKIQLGKDEEAAKAYFLEHVNPNTVFFHSLEEKLEYLIENGYIEEEFLNKYDMKFIKKVFKHIYDKDFRFRSFMGAYKFYNRYALRTTDKKRYLERFEDRLAFNALYIADGNKEMAMDLAEELITQRYVPATPTILNSGKKRRGEMVSCFLLSISDDMNSIGRTVNSALQLSKLGGGVGLNLSNLRCSGDPIKGIDNSASGVVPVMKMFEDAFTYSNQLGQRDGAGVVYLNVFHPDIVNFLSVRKENADEKIRIKTLSLGIVVPDKFYELIKYNNWMYLFSPYDVEREYGKPFSHVNITKEYENMVNNPNIKKSKIHARDLETEISKLQDESGYPYVINIDHANNANPVHGDIIMSNLCTEIFQVQKESKINNDQTYDFLGNDISCNLGSTNIANLMGSPDFGRSVRVMLRALNQISDSSSIDTVSSVKNGNDLYHSVGLGAMNLHGFLAKNRIEYGSPESIEFTSIYFLLLNYWTLYESNKIAKERRTSFFEFDKSDYANGKYFDEYINKDWKPKLDKVKELFKNIFIPSQKDWVELKENIQHYGLYNSYRLATAPTGSISYINEATASIHPIISRIEERLEGKTGKVYYPAPYLSDETLPYYKSAYDIDMRKMIDVYAAATRHVDQGLSMTLFIQSEIPDGLYDWKENSKHKTKKTTRDLNKLRNYAWSKGIKSIYYVRTYTDDGDEVGVNQCESCSI
nr:class 1b ribonucleoside-diphosphate reductase subunit alpha [Paraliobacillus ryukyuensis]